jgi:hypothetical protein
LHILIIFLNISVRIASKRHKEGWFLMMGLFPENNVLIEFYGAGLEF